MILRNLFAAALFASALFTTCASNTDSKTTDPKISAENQAKADSLLLTYNPKKEDKFIAAFAQNLHKKYGFNGNILVAKKGKILYEKAIGWADYLHRDSLKINSEFELASLSKTFTGVAILQLVEAGKLSLNDNVKKFYPNFPYDGITVKLLLTHRSGMMNYVYFIDDIWRKEKRDMKKGVSNQEVMQI